MSDSNELMKKALNLKFENKNNQGNLDAFRNHNVVKTITNLPNVASKSKTNLAISAGLALGAGLILKKGHLFAKAAKNMRNFLPGYYSQNAVGKVGILAKEGIVGMGKASRSLRSPELALATKTTDLQPAIKQSLDELFAAKNIALKNPKNWIKVKGETPGTSIISDLDKKINSEFHNAYAVLTRTKGLEYAKKSPLYNVVKNYATYSKESGKVGYKNILKQMDIKDKEVLDTSLSAWNQNLKSKLMTKNINVANFKFSPTLQNQARDAQFSNQGKLAFLAHEKGLIGKGKHIRHLQDYFMNNGYKPYVNNQGKVVKNMFQNQDLKVLIKKTKAGTTHVQYSSTIKSNPHWGGFNANLTFSDKYKGKVGLFGTDMYDIAGDKVAGAALRNTPLLNVQKVKYQTVPLIKSKEPIAHIKPNPRKKYETNSYNKSKETQGIIEEVKAKPYGLKETKEYSKDVEEYFGLLDKKGMQLNTKTRFTKTYSEDVKTYYKLFTDVSSGTATAIQKRNFYIAKARLGIETAGPLVAGASILAANAALNDD